jgi:UDP-N-acetylmuramate dehydrogenase
VTENEGSAVPRLSDLTTLRLGGPPDRYVAAHTERHLIRAVQIADSAAERTLLIGGGSNLVVGDDGPRGLTIHVKTSGVSQRDLGAHRARLTVAAGMPWDEFVSVCVEQGLRGVEALSGIPGTVGATPVQNVGAYCQSVQETISHVRVFDRYKGEVRTMAREECEFSYRASVFSADPGACVILDVTFELESSPFSVPIDDAETREALGFPEGEAAPLRVVRERVLAVRRTKGMVLDPGDKDTWSVGSFFKNPLTSTEAFAQLERRVQAALASDQPLRRKPLDDGRIMVPAAWLIERAGFLPGYPLEREADAPVALSTKHALALTNRGSGTTRELLALGAKIRDAVAARFGVDLQPEPMIVGAELPAPVSRW